MFSFLQTIVPRTNTAAQNPVFFEDGRSSLEFHTPDHSYMMRHTLPPANVPSFLVPPMHLHLFQSESFKVVSGTGAFFLRPTAKSPGPVLVSQGETIVVPAGAYHRLENGDQNEQLIMDIQFDPVNGTTEENFFRCFFGYLEDCRKHGKNPSLLQLMTFLHSVDAPLAMPLPDFVGETVKKYVSKGVLVLGAAVGRAIGYQATYQEYYRERAE
ncbi:hypothetical protein FRB96_006302 [Tulasnella sp. 330]|nr:hypothetical protein FRB96_006302 [Tulasnella sp. 330]KAG8885088.1 hypothetical protein FRB97_002253 [Tulasnella sp. 331]KAG8890625.1 hypothetical protein FRB98_007180 [Tulasnella sp. 332]